MVCVDEEIEASASLPRRYDVIAAGIQSIFYADACFTAVLILS
jgi:hypothetical protein